MCGCDNHCGPENKTVKSLKVCKDAKVCGELSVPKKTVLKGDVNMQCAVVKPQFLTQTFGAWIYSCSDDTFTPTVEQRAARSYL